MKCGNCDKTDGLCYTSNPPKVKCIVTGEFHGYDDKCDAIETNEPSICTACIVCGEPVKLTSMEIARLDRGHDPGSKVCDNCKAAILSLRKHLEDVDNPYSQI